MVMFLTSHTRSGPLEEQATLPPQDYDTREWVMAVPNLWPKSDVVLEKAPNYNAVQIKVLNSNTPKQEKTNWLNTERIPLTLDVLKSAIHGLITNASPELSILPRRNSVWCGAQYNSTASCHSDPVSSKAKGNENRFFPELVKINEPEWKEREIHFNYINDSVVIKYEGTVTVTELLEGILLYQTANVVKGS
jgi:hypothetical protein